MSVPQAAKYLGVDTSTVYKLIKTGRLPAEELKFIRRNRYRINRADLDRLKRGE